MRPAVVLAILVFSILLLAGCSHPSNEAADEPAATPVEVAAAKQTTMHHVISAEAVLYPVNQATIVPKISAPVRRFAVQRGDHVKQGQLLAVLEDNDLRAATAESRQLYRQAEANLENTRAATLPDDLIKARTDVSTAQEAYDAAAKLYENRVALFKEGALAQKLVDDAKVALVQAKSQLEMAKQHVNSLQTVGQPSQLKSAEAQAGAAQAHYESSAAQSSYGEVRSPIAGIVADRGVNIGDMAGSGSALFTIVDVSRIVARASVPVNQAAGLQPGQSAMVSDGESEFPGKVKVVSPSVDPNTTTVQVWVELANPKETLKLGSTVSIHIQAGDIPNAVSVPAVALLASDEGGEKVMVADANNTAEERKVQVGVRNGDGVQILSGVKPGENVITQGALGLDNKAKIEIGKPGAKEKDDDK